jgi:N-acetylglucosaminyldiphosphoundecaprenol N-acetyl-beta-D-mannosaminyltransferase
MLSTQLGDYLKMTETCVREKHKLGASMESGQLPVVQVLGVPVSFVGCEDVLRVVERARDLGERRYFVVTNAHSILQCRRDREMLAATLGATLVLPDGVGASLAARLLAGGNEWPRIPGPELMLYMLDKGRSVGLRHYLYGARPDVLEDLSERLQQLFPGVLIVGKHSPPFRTLTDAEDECIVEEISSTTPDIVWVGLGAPKQEKWMANHVGRIRAAAMFGVGAAFDFHSGAVPWAPQWIRQAGLEWVFRLVQEPRRLWKRNLDSPLFVALVCGQKTGLLR